MSTVATVLAEPSTAVLAQGLNEMVQVKSNETLATVRVVGSLIGTVAAVWIMGKARFAVGSVVLGIFVGGLIVWGVFNVVKIKDSVDEEWEGGTSGEVSAPLPSSHGPVDLTQPIQL